MDYANGGHAITKKSHVEYYITRHSKILSQKSATNKKNLIEVDQGEEDDIEEVPLSNLKKAMENKEVHFAIEFVILVKEGV